jgi:hypothetical protein
MTSIPYQWAEGDRIVHPNTSLILPAFSLHPWTLSSTPDSNSTEDTANYSQALLARWTLREFILRGILHLILTQGFRHKCKWGERTTQAHEMFTQLDFHVYITHFCIYLSIKIHSLTLLSGKFYGHKDKDSLKALSFGVRKISIQYVQ